MLSNDIRNLRKLAGEYYNIVHNEHNAECIKLHKASNGLRMIRPTVLIDELPWWELDFNGELTLRCEDSDLRDVELYMRRELYKFKYLRADMIVRPYIPVHKVIKSTGIGLTVDEKTVATNVNNEIVSHEFRDQILCMEDIEQLHPAIITYDSEETDRRYNKIGETIGDMLPIRKVGLDYFGMGTWDTISSFRGVTPLLMDLVDKPDFCHALVQRLTEIFMDMNQQYLQQGLFDNDPWSLHCTPIMCDELYPDDFTGVHKDFSTLWGRGAAQIFGSVSREMHEEFDITYMAETIGRCGLVYYGCCEPLEHKIDIVEKIPHLRKISITPWADVQTAAQIIGKRYVVAAKPNPALVGTSTLDKEALQSEISNILDACKKNDCTVEIVLKDISTCNNRPENIFEWEQVVMDMVRNY